jgi:membrane protein DedA with SNARE-associated domain
VEDVLEFVVEHGYVILFVWTLVERAGIPLPAIPILLAAGALSASGEMNALAVLAIASLASLAADLVWYALGRRNGARVLRILCRLSLEPDSCVRSTEGAFEKHGASALLFAKFVPAFNVAAAPIAGMLGMRLRRFVAYDLAGSLIWVLAFTVPGYIFHDRLEAALDATLRLGMWLTVLVVLPIASYVAFKFVQRHRFLREIATSKITAEALHRRLAAGEDIAVVDLRHRVEFAADPDTLPGAIHVPVEEFETRREEVPTDREVVLFCT